MEGTCKFFNQEKFYGFIEIEGDQSFFFHGADIRGAVPGSGARVSFDLSDDPRRAGEVVAVNIKQLDLLDGGSSRQTAPNIVFVANLSFRLTEDDLMGMFGGFGVVVAVRLIRDRATAQSRGFAFVEMEHDRAAARAIQELDGKELDGRRLALRVANQRVNRQGKD